MDNHLACLDAKFELQSTSLWSENAPKEEEQVAQSVANVDDKVNALQLESRKSQYESDTLALARDVAQLGRLLRAVTKSEAAARTEQVLHLKHQNAIGAGIVASFMDTHFPIACGSPKEQIPVIDKVGCSFGLES